MSAPQTIVEAAAALRDGSLTATELVEASIAAAEASDKELGIYMLRFDEQALEAAAAADAKLAKGEHAGALHGIPLGIKDIIATTEGPTTAQSLVLDPAWGQSQGDAVVVSRLRGAGGIISGKTTTMEYATGVPDLTKPFPVPRNPWNPEYWTGGSSSGTGNGVVAGAFLGGLGTDTGGSIRLPAAFCGISGLKATYGRVPKSGCVPLGYSLDHIGPMARSAADCALMLGALAGYDASDPTAADEPIADYLIGLTGDLSGLTIGVDGLKRAWPDRTEDVDVLFAAAVAELEQRGAKVVDVELPWYDAVTAANRITSRSEALAYHLPDLQSRWGDYFEATRQGVGSGAFFTGADYVQAQRVRRAGQKAVGELFAVVDLVVTPTSSAPAPKIAELASHPTWMGASHTGYWNALGNPALAVPMGFTAAQGLPLSLQIIGRPFEEAAVLRAGDAYQQATDWHLRVPDALAAAA